MCAEVVDPAVPDECANVDISSNTVDVDEGAITTLAVPADGNDFIAMMAENLKKQLASQGINVKPFNTTEEARIHPALSHRVTTPQNKLRAK